MLKMVLLHVLSSVVGNVIMETGSKNPVEIISMAPHVVTVVFFLWGALCYIVGVAAPWTYLSFKVTAKQSRTVVLVPA